MEELRLRICHLEEQLEQLHGANLVLTTIVRSLLHSLPADSAQEAAEHIRFALEDEAARLEYEDSPAAPFFQEAADRFFSPR